MKKVVSIWTSIWDHWEQKKQQKKVKTDSLGFDCLRERERPVGVWVQLCRLSKNSKSHLRLSHAGADGQEVWPISRSIHSRQGIRGKG